MHACHPAQPLEHNPSLQERHERQEAEASIQRLQALLRQAWNNADEVRCLCCVHDRRHQANWAAMPYLFKQSSQK
jgi:hypothetical protein